MYERIPKNNKNTTDTPASNQFASRPFVAQPQTEQKTTPKQQQKPAENAHESGDNLVDIPLYPSNYQPPAPPRVQMKRNSNQPGNKYQEKANFGTNQFINQTGLSASSLQHSAIQREEDGKGSAPVPVEKTDAERFAEIEKVLDTIPTGKEALQLMKTYKVSVQFKTGGGSYYISATNLMIIDTKNTPERAALAFVHEMNHARYNHEQLGANVRSSTREDYLQKMVQEESEGVVKSIEAKMELEGSAIDTSKLSYPLEKQYKEAYKVAVDAATSAQKSAAEVKQLGREAGKTRVIKGFMDGEVKTSNTKESYPDYYGKYWDRVNAKKSNP